jgi:Rab GDP dissociation inhibitor
MSMMEKTRAVQFFRWVDLYNKDDPKTFSAGVFSKKTLKLDEMSSKDFFAYWGLESDTMEFIGHALALYTDDSFMDGMASQLVSRIKLYKDSLLRFNDMKSPYIYPLYGLGELPQAFARLAAVYGGLYMLDRDIDELVYEDGVCVGVKAEDTIAKAKVVIGDPSYFPEQVDSVGKVVRAIAITDHPLPNTADCPSCQVIIPQGQVNRKNDVYVFCISESHKVAPAGKFITFASTTVEGETDGLSAQQVAERELPDALKLLNPTIEIFYDMYDIQVPKDDGIASKCFISKGYDPTSHFESAITDVIEMYARITGKPLELNDKKDDAQ